MRLIGREPVPWDVLLATVPRDQILPAATATRGGGGVFHGLGVNSVNPHL